jgi:opacity protein-like surface antigen
MKKILALVLILTVALGVAQAGDNAKPITKAGSTALMFDLGGLANLSAGAYQGGFGAKYYLANGFAVRVSLGFSSSSTTTKNPTTPTPTTQLGESKYTSTSFTVAPGIQYNVATSNAVVGYVGAQVAFTTGSQERTGNANGFGVGFTKDNSYNESNTSFGVAAFVGVEWFAWDNISLAGEYRAGFNTTSGKAESKNATTSVSVDAPSNTSMGLSSGNSACLTLSVFF